MNEKQGQCLTALPLFLFVSVTYEYTTYLRAVIPAKARHPITYVYTTYLRAVIPAKAGIQFCVHRMNV